MPINNVVKIYGGTVVVHINIWLCDVRSFELYPHHAEVMMITWIKVIWSEIAFTPDLILPCLSIQLDTDFIEEDRASFKLEGHSTVNSSHLTIGTAVVQEQWQWGWQFGAPQKAFNTISRSAVLDTLCLSRRITSGPATPGVLPENGIWCQWPTWSRYVSARNSAFKHY